MYCDLCVREVCGCYEHRCGLCRYYVAIMIIICSSYNIMFIVVSNTYNIHQNFEYLLHSNKKNNIWWIRILKPSFLISYINGKLDSGISCSTSVLKVFNKIKFLIITIVVILHIILIYHFMKIFNKFEAKFISRNSLIAIYSCQSVDYAESVIQNFCHSKPRNFIEQNERSQY